MAKRTRSSSLSPPPKPKKASGSKWPPAALDPSLHPSRSGQPVYQFSSIVKNGRIGTPPDLSNQQPLFIGAHMSIGGGVGAGLLRAGLAGANGVAMFMKGHRTWKAKEFEPESVQRFIDLMKSKKDGGLGYGPETILVHGNYLINLGNPDSAKWKQAYECFRDDVSRCHQLGIKLYNWHPGSTVGACTKEESFKLVAKAINQVHKDVPEVVTVIENMATHQANAGSNILGTAFSDLRSMIDLVDDKSRVRVCIDTCHLFAAGYDMRTAEAYDATMKKFDEEVGVEYLGGIHLNDSKADLGGNKDLHENIGLGKIGLTGFRSLVRDPRMVGIPMILETPCSDASDTPDSLWSREIKLLYEIQAVEEEDWAKKSVEIEKRWRKERDTIDPPKAKVAKGGKGKKGKKGDDDDDEDDE